MRIPVTIGDLRHRVTLERPERTPDGAGGSTTDWIAVAELWAAIWPRVSDEALTLDRVAGIATHDIWLRYRAGVVPEMRVRFGTRVFDIRGVINFEERGRWLKCVAEERDL